MKLSEISKWFSSIFNVNFLKSIFKPNLKECLEYFKSDKEANSRINILTINIIFICLFMLILWASFTSIQEVARAPGVIMPAGQNFLVQHLYGGTVESILVENNSKVKKGQNLVTLDSTIINSELNQLKDEKFALIMDLIRLKSFIKNEKINEDIIREKLLNLGKENNINFANYTENVDKAILSTVELLDHQYIAKENEINLLDKKILKLEDESKHAEKLVTNLQERLNTIGQTKEMYEKLKNNQAVSKITLMNAIDKYDEIEDKFLQAESKLKNLKNNLSLTKQQKTNINDKYKERSLNIINEKNKQLLAVNTNINKQNARLKELVIKSPADGIINGLTIDIDSIIEPGATILEIVPFDKELIVEAKISTLDIGHIKVGDEVNIKVSTFNYSNYGNINGKVKSISASTFLSKDNKPFYKAIIKLEKSYLGKNPDINKVIPGMTVTADIKTGERSLIAYLFKPIHKTFNNSFGER